MKSHYKDVVKELKKTSTSEYVKMAKRLGATDQKDPQKN